MLSVSEVLLMKHRSNWPVRQKDAILQLTQCIYRKIVQITYFSSQPSLYWLASLK